MSRTAAMLVLVPCLLCACGRRSEERKEGDKDRATQEADGKQDAEEPPVKLPTALPETRPSPFEAEYHVDTPGSDQLVSAKVSDKGGANVSLGDREHRVVIAHDLTPADLDRVYAGLRAAAFDRIETTPSRERRPGGSSLRLLAGSARKTVADLGNVYPDEEWAAEYDAAAKALEPLLPAPPKDAAATLEVRWDASMKGHRATVALALGPDYAGATTVGGDTGDVRVGLTKSRTITATLRSGPPAKSTDVQLDPAVHGGVEVVFDAETSSPVARPFAVQAPP